MATTYPLPTLAPTISAAGISAPQYSDVLASLQASFLSIYGSDAVLDNSSQDGQLLAVFAQAIYDCGQACVATFNAYSPSTAQGAGLSSVIKINGIRRLVSSYSSVVVNIVGQAGTIITNGLISDGSNQYALPPSVTIPIGGTVSTTAIAVSPGAILSAAGAVTKIVTPTLGWQTVTNPSRSIPGAPVEQDAQLRQRQTVSTGLPALTVLEGMFGALSNLPGVLQVAAYENDTNSTNSLGIPAHSVSFVVEGGSASDITATIANTKTPGTGTYGTTSATVIDQNGVPDTISYYVPTTVPIDVAITIKALPNYVSTTGTEIVTQETGYLNGLPIFGVNGYVYNSKLYSPANDTGSLANTYNVVSITARRGTNAYAATDIALAFYELPVAGNIALTVT